VIAPEAADTALLGHVRVRAATLRALVEVLSRLVPGADAEAAGADVDLPPWSLGQDVRSLGDVRDETGRMLDEVGARERRLPQRQPIDGEGVLVLAADGYGTWDKP
jgi:hypothetical protein